MNALQVEKEKRDLQRQYLMKKKRRQRDSFLEANEDSISADLSELSQPILQNKASMSKVILKERKYSLNEEEKQAQEESKSDEKKTEIKKISQVLQIIAYGVVHNVSLKPFFS